MLFAAYRGRILRHALGADLQVLPHNGAIVTPWLNCGLTHTGGPARASPMLPRRIARGACLGGDAGQSDRILLIARNWPFATPRIDAERQRGHHNSPSCTRALQRRLIMSHLANQARENAARVLAVIAAANGRVKDCELQTLEDLRAFTRLGISRRRFLQMARKGIDEVGGFMNQRGHLHAADYLYLDDLLHGVRDRGLRLLVCRLAVAVITADGCVTASERAAYRHMLLRWHLDTSAVDDAVCGGARH